MDVHPPDASVAADDIPYEQAVVELPCHRIRRMPGQMIGLEYKVSDLNGVPIINRVVNEGPLEWGVGRTVTEVLQRQAMCYNARRAPGTYGGQCPSVILVAVGYEESHDPVRVYAVGLELLQFAGKSGLAADVDQSIRAAAIKGVDDLVTRLSTVDAGRVHRLSLPLPGFPYAVRRPAAQHLPPGPERADVRWTPRAQEQAL